MGMYVDMGLRSILFVDLDHTVMQGSFSYAVYDVACGKIARASGLSIEQVRSLVAQENRDRMEDPDVSAVKAMDWDDIVETVADRLEVKLEMSVLDLVKAHAQSPYIKELDQARKVLARLRKPGRREIVAATNGLSKYQTPVLVALGLQDCFAAVLSPEQTGVLKDNKAFYGNWPYQARLLKVMVGDNYQYDVKASLGHGFQAIWYLDGKKSRKETSEPADHSDELEERACSPSIICIRSLKELPRIIWWLELRAWWQKLFPVLKNAQSSDGTGLKDAWRQGFATVKEAFLFALAVLREAF